MQQVFSRGEVWSTAWRQRKGRLTAVESSRGAAWCRSTHGKLTGCGLETPPTPGSFDPLRRGGSGTRAVCYAEEDLPLEDLEEAGYYQGEDYDEDADVERAPASVRAAFRGCCEIAGAVQGERAGAIRELLDMAFNVTQARPRPRSLHFTVNLSPS